MLFHIVLEICGAKDSHIVDLGMDRCKKIPSHSDFTSEDRASYNCLAEEVSPRASNITVVQR
jgi:hypothetical protein